MSAEENTVQPSVERPRRVDRVVFPVLDGITFSARRDGGYEPEEVDSLLKELRDVLDAADDERTALRADVAQYKDRLEERGPSEITVDAVGLLSQAQVIADKCIADAETYARDLMMTARSQYREVLERAEKSAAEAARQVEEQATDHGTGGAPDAGTSGAGVMPPVQPVPEVEYVRTYAQVAQVQLRAVLDALAEQVEMLGRVPASGDGSRQRRPAQGAASGGRDEASRTSSVDHPAGSEAMGQTGWPVGQSPDSSDPRSYGEVVWEHQGVG